MLTEALTGFGAVAALLSPALVYLAARQRTRRSEITDLHDRLDERDAKIAALWNYVLDLRYSMVKGTEPPTMPATLTIAAVRARATAAA